jgi:broad specificity phosphatase PhoE
VLSELREVDFGDWTGLSWDGVKEKFGVSAFSWLEQLDQARIPNAESAAQLRSRLEPCLRDILRRHKQGDVAVLCHGGVIRMLLAILTGWSFSSMGGLEVEYASISQVSVSPGRTRLQLLNLTPWRDLAKVRSLQSRKTVRRLKAGT